MKHTMHVNARRSRAFPIALPRKFWKLRTDTLRLAFKDLTIAICALVSSYFN